MTPTKYVLAVFLAFLSTLSQAAVSYTALETAFDLAPAIAFLGVITVALVGYKLFSQGAVIVLRKLGWIK